MTFEYLSARKEVNMMKKLIGTVLGIGMILAAAAPSFAATNVTLNNTGPFANHWITILKGRTIGVNNIQAAKIKNTVNNTVNTGNNTATLNTNVTGGIGTGNATSNVTINNTVNGALTTVEGCLCQDSDTNVDMSNTGPYSTQNVTVNETSNITVNNLQFAKVKNKVFQNINTGGNNAILNTNVSGIATGDASSDVVVDNVVNVSETNIGP